MLALLVSASFLGSVDAVEPTDHLGIVRSYTSGDLEAKAAREDWEI